MKQYMIQCFTPDLSRLYKYSQVLNDLLLAGEIADMRGPYVVLEFFVGRSQIAFITIKIRVIHELSLIIFVKLTIKTLLYESRNYRLRSGGPDTGYSIFI